MSIQIGHLVSPDLLKALNECFPLERPRISDHERSIWIRSGHREVIEFLQAQHDEAVSQSLERVHVPS